MKKLILIMLVMLNTAVFSQGVKISQMNPGTPALGTDAFPIQRGNSNFKLTVVDVAGYIGMSGTTWLDPVSSIRDSVACTEPDSGARYIAIATTGGWTHNYIYTCNGSGYVETVPHNGNAVVVIDSSSVYVYNGTSWVPQTMSAASYWAKSGNHIFNINPGSVGINMIPSASYKLDVNGDSRVNNYNLRLGGGLFETKGLIKLANSGSSTRIGVFTNAVERMSFASNATRVGIGIITPQNTLDINGTLQVRNSAIGTSVDSLQMIEGGVFKSIAASNLGVVGPTGATGATGANGATGINGVTGATGIGYVLHSTQSPAIPIGLGTLTFTSVSEYDVNSAFVVGMRVRAVARTAPTNYMEGVITSFASNAMVINADIAVGSGSYEIYDISITGIVGATGVAGATGSTGSTGTSWNPLTCYDKILVDTVQACSPLILAADSIYGTVANGLRFKASVSDTTLLMIDAAGFNMSLDNATGNFYSIMNNGSTGMGLSSALFQDYMLWNGVMTNSMQMDINGINHLVSGMFHNSNKQQDTMSITSTVTGVNSSTNIVQDTVQVSISSANNSLSNISTFLLDTTNISLTRNVGVVNKGFKVGASIVVNLKPDLYSNADTCAFMFYDSSYSHDPFINNFLYKQIVFNKGFADIQERQTYKTTSPFNYNHTRDTLWQVNDIGEGFLANTLHVQRIKPSRIAKTLIQLTDDAITSTATGVVNSTTITQDTMNINSISINSATNTNIHQDSRTVGISNTQTTSGYYGMNQITMQLQEVVNDAGSSKQLLSMGSSVLSLSSAGSINIAQMLLDTTSITSTATGVVNSTTITQDTMTVNTTAGIVNDKIVMVDTNYTILSSDYCVIDSTLVNHKDTIYLPAVPVNGQEYLIVVTGAGKDASGLYGNGKSIRLAGEFVQYTALTSLNYQARLKYSSLLGYWIVY